MWGLLIIMKEKIKKLKNKFNNFSEQIIIGKGILPDYKINKKIFRLFLGILLILIGMVLINSPQNHYISLECQGPNLCQNQLYVCNPKSEHYTLNKYPICDMINSSMYKDEFLTQGTKLGNPPPFILKNINYIFISLTILAFIINHFLYNKKYFKGKITWH